MNKSDESLPKWAVVLLPLFFILSIVWWPPFGVPILVVSILLAAVVVYPNEVMTFVEKGLQQLIKGLPDVVSVFYRKDVQFTLLVLFFGSALTVIAFVLIERIDHE